MSADKPEAREDFSEGLQIAMVTRIFEDQPGGQSRIKVLLDYGRLAGPRLTVALNEKNELYFEGTSFDGRKVRTPPVSFSELPPDLFVLGAYLDARENHPHLRLEVNGKPVSNVLLEGNWSGPVKSDVRLGADLNGENPAKFKLGELRFLRGNREDVPWDVYLRYLASRYGLKL